jgi:hypothetical protein
MDMVENIEAYEKKAADIEAVYLRSGYSHGDFWTMVDDIGYLLAYIRLLKIQRGEEARAAFNKDLMKMAREDPNIKAMIR